MRAPARLLLGAAAMMGVGAVTGQPEFILPAILLAGTSAGLKVVARHRAMRASFAELERRVRLTEGELDVANSELAQLKVEREFDRQLLHSTATQT